jgi:ribosomal protein S18 acetylase RimI-like enzyme
MAEHRPDLTVIRAREQELPAIEGILRRAGAFQEPEIAVGLEVLESFFLRPSLQDSQVYTASLAGVPVGYVRFGRNTLTDGVFELSWLAVDPGHRRRGVGRSLITLAEYEATRQGGRMMVVEVPSREECYPARKLCHDLGYRQAALVPDYYAVGDGKVILVRKLARPA